MKNVEIKVAGTILTIKVDLSKEQGLSSSQKNIIVGTTSGNATVDGPDGPVKVGVNVYRPKG